jgi:sulfoxide reductase heme-binding subunit YedZ
LPSGSERRRRAGERRRGGGSDRPIRWVAKPLVFALALLPLVWLALAWLAPGWLAPEWLASLPEIGAVRTGSPLGANPIEATNRFLGDWALRLLLLTLAIAPLRILTGSAAPMRFRRMLGLFAFFYAVLHLASYVGLDQFFAWGEIWADIVKRTFITVGMLAFLLLIPLAITSTKGWIKRLGARRWQRLHRLVYPAAILACLHYVMMVKADLREPLIHAGILALLLGLRLARRAPRPVAPAAADPRQG